MPDSTNAAIPSSRAKAFVPRDGLIGLKENWTSDLMSGFILFLIALPLSLGIAMASGMPPMAGIFSAIVGGVLVSLISGSFVTINGPAAGLIVVVLGSVERLGGGPEGIHGTLAAIVVSGLILFVAGLCNVGNLSKFFPSSVVHGMLASIGITIILKQMPLMLGVTPPAKEPIALLLKIPYSISHLNPEIAAIGLTGLCVLVCHTFVRSGFLKKVPPPIIVVLAGCAIGHCFNIGTPHEYVFMGQTFSVLPKALLVQLPLKFGESFASPDWHALSKAGFFLCVAQISLVQGIETVLSCQAVEKLDPYKRQSNGSRDLAAVGIGSALSGMIGGLPMIAEIVRSTANITNGARTRWSNCFHGLFILIFVSTCAGLINYIPLASLAALLVFTGYRLSSPKVFQETLEIGREQLLLFCATCFTALYSDLLVGVATGIAIKFILHLLRGVPAGHLFKADIKTVEEPDGAVRVVLAKSVVFSNYLMVKARLDQIERGKAIVVDLSGATFIDHTVMEHLIDYQRNRRDAGGVCEITGLELHRSSGTHQTSTRRLTTVRPVAKVS